MEPDELASPTADDLRPPPPTKPREELADHDLACTPSLGAVDAYLVLLLAAPLAWAGRLATLFAAGPPAEGPPRDEPRDYERMDSRVDASLCFVRLRDRPDWIAAAARWSRAADESETSRRAKLRRELRDPAREHVVAQRNLSGEPVGMGSLEARDGAEPRAAIFVGNTERFDATGRGRVEQALAAYLADVARARGAARMLVATARYEYVFDLTATGYKYRRFERDARSRAEDARAAEADARPLGASTLVRSAASHVFRAASAAAFAISRRTKPAAPEPSAQIVKVWL